MLSELKRPVMTIDPLPTSFSFFFRNCPISFHFALCCCEPYILPYRNSAHCTTIASGTPMKRNRLLFFFKVVEPLNSSNSAPLMYQRSSESGAPLQYACIMSPALYSSANPSSNGFRCSCPWTSMCAVIVANL